MEKGDEISFSKSLVLSPLKATNDENVTADFKIMETPSPNLKERGDYIESCAIVKQSEVEFPVQFHQLKLNTDLNQPPSYWLHGQTSIRFPTLNSRHADFSSFLMSHQFPDSIGEVDIISDAANIKKLLKIPYNPKGHVSMMIHRVGKTILIDEFHVYKYMMRQSKKQWKWLEKFFYENILPSVQQGNVFVRPNKSRDVVQNRNLLSKFLYYSIGEKEKCLVTGKVEESSHVPVCRSPSPPKDVMPDPPIEEHLSQSNDESFTRNIIWNFENLRMLIGTDLPIFGGRKHPCVSLRLRDMSKPINILTGVDYWLDNLMCNVPEVIMCYHLDGVVQKYELVKTEDLPQITDSEFSPHLIRDIAHNILSFLKTKATKEGHTYWLFKGKDCDYIKLYDLTSLGNEESQEPAVDEAINDDDNPFTVPVAMLFYRVAINLRNSEDLPKNEADIRSALSNTISLLDQRKYPEVYSSSHYMLSDVYIPQYINAASDLSSGLEKSGWDLEDKIYSSVDKEREINQTRMNKKGKKENSVPSIEVSSLCVPLKKGRKSKNCEPPPITKKVFERCELALSHVFAALTCLRRNMVEETEEERSEEVIDPKVPSPNQPIPMPYSPLKNLDDPEPKDEEDFSNKQPQSQSQSEPQSKSKEHNKPLSVSNLSTQYEESSWRDQSLVLCLRKAALIYLVLARMQFNHKRYDLTIKYIKTSLHSWHAMSYYLRINPKNVPLPGQAYSLAGDTYYLMSKDLEYVKELDNMHELHLNMVAILGELLDPSGFSCDLGLPSSTQEAMEYSLNMFRIASVTIGDNDDVLLPLKRRMASIGNELGVLFMNEAKNFYDLEVGEAGRKRSSYYWSKSKGFLESALHLFHEVDDKSNMALIHNNIARLHRLNAFYDTGRNEQSDKICSSEEHYYYKLAIDQYKDALELLRSPTEEQKKIVQLINWEFCTTLYTVGTLFHDNPKEQMPEVVDKLTIFYLDWALKICDLKNKEESKLPLYQYRAAEIYIRLAGIYHKAYRNKEGDPKHMRHLAELNYNRASVLFLLFEDPFDILKVHLDHAVLLEDSMEGCNPQSRLKNSISLLRLLLSCQSVLNKVSSHAQTLDTNRNNSGKKMRNKKGKKLAKAEKEEMTEEEKKKINNLLELFEKKLQTTLFSMTKILKAKAKGKENSSCALLKSLYSKSLNLEREILVSHLVECSAFVDSHMEELTEIVQRF